MLEHEELHAVYVCVPPFAHDGQEEAVARRGLALLVEKPLSLDLAYAQRVAEVIGECGVINAVGYQYRYLDVVEEAPPRSSPACPSSPCAVLLRSPAVHGMVAPARAIGRTDRGAGDPCV